MTTPQQPTQEEITQAVAALRTLTPAAVEALHTITASFRHLAQQAQRINCDMSQWVLHTEAIDQEGNPVRIHPPWHPDQGTP